MRMASAAELLSELRTLDIRLSVEGDRLRCNAPRGHLTPEPERRIATHKQKLLAELRASSSPPLTIAQRSASTASIPLLGGHCVGKIAALEVARLLMQQREEVGPMVFLDTE